MSKVESGLLREEIVNSLKAHEGLIVVAETAEKPRIDGKKGKVYFPSTIHVAPAQEATDVEGLNSFSAGLLHDVSPIYREKAEEGVAGYSRLRSFESRGGNQYTTIEVQVFPSAGAATKASMRNK